MNTKWVTFYCTEARTPCSFKIHPYDINYSQWTMTVFMETKMGPRGSLRDIEGTQKCKTSIENMRLLSVLWKLAYEPWPVLCETVTGHPAGQVTDKWKVCEYEMAEWIWGVLRVNHKWNVSVWSETKMPAECPAGARRGRAADPRVIFTKQRLSELFIYTLHRAW